MYVINYQPEVAHASSVNMFKNILYKYHVKASYT